VDEVKPAACVPTVEHREPCESRGSRTVFWERPDALSGRGNKVVSHLLISFLVEKNCGGGASPAVEFQAKIHSIRSGWLGSISWSAAQSRSAISAKAI
jgi:hypothetical protein